MTTGQPETIKTHSEDTNRQSWAQQRNVYLAKLAAAHALAPLPAIPDGSDELSDDQLQAISAALPNARPAHALISEDRDERL